MVESQSHQPIGVKRENNTKEEGEEKVDPESRVHCLPSSPSLTAILTILRDVNTSRGEFIFYSDRIIRIVVEEALHYLDFSPTPIVTPTGLSYAGCRAHGKLCGVSIMRAGEAMEKGLRDCCRSIRIGKILIQRMEGTAEAKLYYAKLPDDIAERWVLLMDPMLATGNSAIKAMQVLLNAGVHEERILFVNLICCPEGIKNVLAEFPRIRIITACIDRGLNASKYIIPGLGDFGCRYFITDG